jgi:hypothetical protein
MPGKLVQGTGSIWYNAICPTSAHIQPRDFHFTMGRKMLTTVLYFSTGSTIKTLHKFRSNERL